MGKINYKAIYDDNKADWRALTENPQNYEALLAGHYSDSNHFVYELLQNAEDAFETNEKGIYDPKTCISANKVFIEYYDDKLIFYHNGKPFDEGDVRGVSSMLMGTKNREDAQTIGRFGMGFKSVFKYTYQPEIYSDSEAFKITNYLLPVEIDSGWDYRCEKQNIKFRMSHDRIRSPFAPETHLTKIVIPFLKYGKDGNLVKVSGVDVLKKLNELDGEILLFLSHINELYWVDKTSGRYTHISKYTDQNDKNLVICNIEGSAYGDKEQTSYYLKFSKVFDHEEMHNAEVSVAYKLNSRADNINEVDEYPPVWVYFPTRDDTSLPFLIHGSFETAVSREKLMTPSSFNDDLFDELGNLIASSMKDLANRELITQAFLRRIVLAAFEDEAENETIPGLKAKITAVIKENGLLPDRHGEYKKPSSLRIAIPFRIGELEDGQLLGDCLSQKSFVAFNNERELNFNDYFIWLTKDLKVSEYKLSDFGKDLDVLSGENVAYPSKRFDDLKNIYALLQDYRESVYDTGLSYSRSGAYENTIREDLTLAWKRLRRAPIILNSNNDLVPAMINGTSSVYLASSSDYKKLNQSSIVNRLIADSFSKVLTEGFRIKEFNNFTYVNEKVIRKYIEVDDDLVFDDEDNYVDEYIEDINQILTLVKDTSAIEDVKELLKNASIIKIKSEDTNDDVFSVPGECYVPKSDEGIDLNVYFDSLNGISGIDGTESDCANYEPIDWHFYEENGIQISKLSKLGMVTTPVVEGRRNQNGHGDSYWVAIGEYCPEIEIVGLYENIMYITRHPYSELAKKKSSELLKLLIAISGKLKGKRKFRKTNPYPGEIEEAKILRDVIRKFRWVYSADGSICRITDISYHDLNSDVYSSVQHDKSAYSIIGFAKKAIDGTEETLEKAQKLSDVDKRRLVDLLAKDLGLRIAEDSTQEDEDYFDGNEAMFNPEEYVDNEFPVRNVRNVDYLTHRVQEQFFCADPITYERVLRRIRTSKNSVIDNTYIKGMYTNNGNRVICQMCMNPSDSIVVDQISNYGIEMPQLHLCLCSSCSPIYKRLAIKRRGGFKDWIKELIENCDSSDYNSEFVINLDNQLSLHFTQTHLVEIQEIFKLLSEFGVPNATNYLSGVDSVVSERDGKVNQEIVEEIKVSNEQLVLDYNKVPVELRDDADTYDVTGDLQGQYLMTPFQGKLKQYTNHMVKQMFIVLSDDKKGKPQNILVFVNQKDRIIYIPKMQYMRFQSVLATSVLRIQNETAAMQSSNTQKRSVYL